jgi:hypothetical protein
MSPSVLAIQSCAKAAIDNSLINGQSCAPIKKSLKKKAK